MGGSRFGEEQAEEDIVAPVVGMVNGRRSRRLFFLTCCGPSTVFPAFPIALGPLHRVVFLPP